MEFEKPSPKLLITTGLFLISSLVFGLLLGSSMETISLTREGLLGCLPVLVCFLVVGSLAIIFSLVSGWKTGLSGLLAASALFGLFLTALSPPWRLWIAAVFFVGLLLLRIQARRVHEAYTGFSASHYRGVMQTFFFFFIFALAAILFFLSRQAVGRKRVLIPQETLEPVVGQVVTMFGGLMSQEFGGNVPEDVLAPVVEEALFSVLQQLGLGVRPEGQPASLAEVTMRISKVAEEGLAEAITPLKPYVPFVLAGLALFTLAGFSPVVVPLGAFVFLLVYRLLLLVRLLKLKEVERTVKRLALS